MLLDCGLAIAVVSGGQSPGQTHACSATGAEVTGQTVFNDRPLRFRSLTVTEADFPALENPLAIEGAFKIRVATLGIGPIRYRFYAVFLRNDLGRDLFPEVSPQDCLNRPFCDRACKVLRPMVVGKEWFEV